MLDELLGLVSIEAIFELLSQIDSSKLIEFLVFGMEGCLRNTAKRKG